jgi:hypothetical protein
VIPDYKKDVEAAKARYPEAWSHAHVTDDPKRWDFIKLLAFDLNKKDPKVGLNGKRGNPNDLSMDALNYLCDNADSDGRTPEGLPCAVVDCIASAGIPSASPIWNPFITLVEGSGAWVKPGAVTPPTPTYPGYEELGGDAGGIAVTKLMEADYKRAEKAGLDGASGAWQWRTAYDFLTRKVATIDASIAKHQPEWRQSLNDERAANGKPPIAW